MPRSKGFTLVELMIAIAILGIIASIAMPAMGKFIIQQRVSSQANEMMLSLAFARSEAIKRNASVAVIPVTNASTGWSDGWCVGTIAIDNCDHAEVLRTFTPASNVSITSAYLATGSTRLTFLRDGTACTTCADVPISITSPKLEAAGDLARCISVNRQGRPEVLKVTRDAGC